MQPLHAGAHRDGKQRLWVPSNSALSPHLLLSLCLPGVTPHIHRKLAVHDTAFCLQQMMKGVQADTLGTAAHLLVGIGKVAHTSE
jgi:hypothetical protein